jgi:hypothetical protein
MVTCHNFFLLFSLFFNVQALKWKGAPAQSSLEFHIAATRSPCVRFLGLSSSAGLKGAPSWSPWSRAGAITSPKKLGRHLLFEPELSFFYKKLAKPELSGAVGTVIRFHDEKQRYAV